MINVDDTNDVGFMYSYWEVINVDDTNDVGFMYSYWGCSTLMTLMM